MKTKRKFIRKLFICISMLIAVALFATGCAADNADNIDAQKNIIDSSDKTYVNNKALEESQVIEDDRITKENETEFDSYIAEIPLSDIKASDATNITQQEAEELCYSVLGDKDEKMTGFPISYRCISAVATNNKLYYVMNISWLVDNNHWSYIGNCYVSSDGKEIYDGSVSSDKYIMSDLVWKK